MGTSEDLKRSPSAVRSLPIIVCIIVLVTILGVFHISRNAKSLEPVTTANALKQTASERKLLQWDTPAEVPLEEVDEAMGKKAKKKLKKVAKPKAKHAAKQEEVQPCQTPGYANTTLNLISEMNMNFTFPFATEKKFEGSDVIQVANDFYVVFDNLWSIGKIDVNNFSSLRNSLISRNVRGKSGSSGYEAIAYDEVTRQFYVVIESVQEAGGSSFNGVVDQIRMDVPHSYYTLAQRCRSDFIVVAENKGLEGAAVVRVGGRMFLLALCEGNFCMGGNKGKEVGNGRLVVTQWASAVGDSPCLWRTVLEISLPSIAAFRDYSALALRKTNVSNRYDIAVTSQENSQLWVGQLNVGINLSDWSLTSGSVFNFPRDENCDLLYCSVEGIAFLDNGKFVVVSDVGGGTAPGCALHDGSIHVFQLPEFQKASPNA